MSRSIRCVIPVAPRDFKYLSDCIRYLAFSARDAADRLSSRIDWITLDVVFDGPATSTQKQYVTKSLSEASGITSVLDYKFSEFKEPQGAGIARNYGLAHAYPEDLICFMDADDTVYPWSFWTKLNAWYEIADAMPSGAPPKTPFIYTSTVHVIPDKSNPGACLRVIRDIPHPVNVPKWIESQNIFLTTSILTQASLLQLAGGFEPNMICGEDGCLWRRASYKAVMVPVFLPCQTYTVRPDSQCRQLHKANSKAFHLDPSIHGPMGQGLDAEAALRGAACAKLATAKDRQDALCGEIQVEVIEMS